MLSGGPELSALKNKLHLTEHFPGSGCPSLKFTIGWQQNKPYKCCEN